MDGSMNGTVGVFETASHDEPAAWPRPGEHAFGNPFPFTKRLRRYLTEQQHATLKPCLPLSIPQSMGTWRLPRCSRPELNASPLQPAHDGQGLRESPHPPR